MLNQPNYSKEKPKILYRGVIINYQLLKDFQFYGVDLVPPNPPIIDEKGRNTVGDGNEYGVYMTDHEVVARKAYAAVEVNDGMPIKKDVFFGYDRSRTVIPSIGIVYRIDTEGIDVHIPWITSQLQGHYNNGMGGDEWIAESIPASNYSIDTIEIGSDTLHDSEFIKITDITTIKQKLIDIINRRKERLELFENKIETMPTNERLLLDESKIKILKSIYRLNGIMDIDINNYNPQSPKEYMDYLMAVVYIKNKEDIDYKTLTYIKSLKDRVKKDTTIDEIIERVNKDIKRNADKNTEIYERILIELDKKMKGTRNPEKENKNMEQPLRSFLSQANPEIEINPNYINYSQFQRISDEKSQTEKRKNPLVNDNKVIGELEETEVYDFETGTSKTTRFETVESENKIYTIDSEIQTIGKDYSVTATMDILNEISKSKEKATYIRDINGNETYTYMKNGTKEQIIKKTERGTTIDIYKDGQPYETYEYDENGKALVPMGMMEQLPEDYIESCFRMPLPEYEQIQYQEPKNVSTQKLGKETLDMQQDTKTLDDVEKQMEEQEMEINEFGEIIRKGKTNSRFDLGGTMDEAINQTLNEFIQKLDNDDLDDNSTKKKDDEFKVEKGDDDYVR